MKKGFTLIELLAVILILGIIALIAIPTVNNILKEARRGAFESTLTNLEKAIEEKCTLEQIKNIEITTGYTISNGVISPSLDIKGNLPNGTITVNTNCEVAFTLSDQNFTGNKDFVGDIVVSDGSTDINVVYKEAILNGTDPVLSDGLIPVTIDNDGTVRKANESSKWYSYEEKKWANAVLLTNSGQIESNGIIKEEYIKGYFVWIPRYKYKLFDMGNYDGYIENEEPVSVQKDPIEIVFENKDTTPSVGTEVGQYHSHPAFNAFDVNGLWVGKFETSNETTIKPQLSSLQNVNVRTMFESAYNFKRDSESHMMKNIEWGAVAYLTHSKYGRCTTTMCTDLNVNNNSEHLTGYSTVEGATYGASPSETQPYNTEVGYKATTTGNIFGIYDMSGGSEEVVAAYINQVPYSGFDEKPTNIYDSKYFDVYPSDTSTYYYYKRILGDATGELGPFYRLPNNQGWYSVYNNWYHDKGMFLYPNFPWLVRGGDYTEGAEAGILSFNRESIGTSHEFSYRIVLTK